MIVIKACIVALAKYIHIYLTAFLDNTVGSKTVSSVVLLIAATYMFHKVGGVEAMRAWENIALALASGIGITGLGKAVRRPAIFMQSPPPSPPAKPEPQPEGADSPDDFGM